ncbi:MAG: 3-dehydroquinate dehydratase [Acidobacteria bacterium]|nr:3-dehydroquinate dehydratase [Acidobacteriota bacterium]
MSRRVVMVSGPNLNLLGERAPEIYGTATLAMHEATVRDILEPAGIDVVHVQSNEESVLIETIHAARGTAEALIVNLGALTHSSWALRDALDIFGGFVVEVHLSNPAAREPFRHLSTIASVVDGSIAGFGGFGYELAAYSVLRHVS